jgi:signal recognition particle GTPase
MKINKKQINESILVEADEVINNPGTASNAEVAAAVEAGLEAEGQGDVEITKKQAAEIAKDAKDVAKKIEAKKFVPSASVNELTRVLDEALEASLSKKDEEDFFGTDEGVSYNVLVSGLPGSGKTAIVKQ